MGDCYTDGEFSYTGSLNVTESLITETNEILEAEILVRENPLVDLETYDNALAALETAKRKLETAIAYVDLPVQLTFDVDSLVTYKITINRGGYPVLAYDSNRAMVAVTNFDLGEDAHKWYFTATPDADGKVVSYLTIPHLP